MLEEDRVVEGVLPLTTQYDHTLPQSVQVWNIALLEDALELVDAFV